MSTTADAPTFVPPSSRTGLGAVVPFEYLRPVRIALMFTYLAWYLVWLRWRGITVDRVSVALLVAAFLTCAFIGRTWRTWGVLLLDCVAYCVMWISYEATRGVADDGINFGLFRLKFPLQVETMRNIDRFLFFGHDPNWVLQRHFWGTRIRWYDVIACTTYMTHFVFPMIVMAALWATSHRQWARFMKRFATLLFIACLMFVVLPTVPPWMLGSPKFPYQVLPELHRNAGRGFYHIGFNSWSAGYKLALSNGNGVAAMPSLHASFALIVPAFFLPWLKPKWLKALVLVFPVVMLTSLVYLGEHWVIDGLVGWAITGGCFWFWNRMERRDRTRRADRSLAALA